MGLFRLVSVVLVWSAVARAPPGINRAGVFRGPAVHASRGLSGLRGLRGESLQRKGLQMAAREVIAAPPSLEVYEAQLRDSIALEEGARTMSLPFQSEIKESDIKESERKQATEPKRKSRGKEPEMWLDDDSTEVTNTHRVTMGLVWGMSILLLTDAAQHMTGPMDSLLAPLVVGFTMLFADAFSGLFHWAVDNYGNLKTPIFGSIIHSFQGHHSAPWTITFRPFLNNVYKIARVVVPLMALVVATSIGSGLWAWQIAAVVFFNMQILGQEFHKLSHMIKTPPTISKLQNSGILLSKRKHLAHHTSPFEGHYCIVTGHMNPLLDRTRFFRRLERVVYELGGAEPNCWKLKPELKEAVLKGDYKNAL
ncbi:hypothetical protein AAMO2058_000513700 [Amorphochlora amoebiformis]